MLDLLLVAGVEPGVDSVLKIGRSGNHHLFLLLGKHLAEAATEGRHVSFDAARVARVTDYSVCSERDKTGLSLAVSLPLSKVSFETSLSFIRSCSRRLMG